MRIFILTNFENEVLKAFTNLESAIDFAENYISEQLRGFDGKDVVLAFSEFYDQIARFRKEEGAVPFMVSGLIRCDVAELITG